MLEADGVTIQRTWSAMEKDEIAARLRLLVVILLVLSGCEAEPSQLQSLGDEGLSITKRVNFSSSPEAKLQAAEDLLTHASTYDQLISRSNDVRFVAKAHRIQRQEREAVATLMHEAAADYAKRNDIVTARDVYQSVFTSFPEEEYLPIRRAAESSLNQLNDTQKETK